MEQGEGIYCSSTRTTEEELRQVTQGGGEIEDRRHSTTISEHCGIILVSKTRPKVGRTVLHCQYKRNNISALKKVRNNPTLHGTPKSTQEISRCQDGTTTRKCGFRSLKRTDTSNL